MKSGATPPPNLIVVVIAAVSLVAVVVAVAPHNGPVVNCRGNVWNRFLSLKTTFDSFGIGPLRQLRSTQGLFLIGRGLGVEWGVGS